MRKEDLSLLLEWRNDPESVIFFHYSKPMSLAHLTMWFNFITHSKTTYVYIVYLHNIPVASLALKNINKQEQKCELGIYLVKEYRGAGLYFNCMLMIEQILKILHLSTVIHNIHIDNIQSLRCVKHIGGELIKQEDKRLIFYAYKEQRQKMLAKIAKILHYDVEFDSILH